MQESDLLGIAQQAFHCGTGVGMNGLGVGSDRETRENMGRKGVDKRGDSMEVEEEVVSVSPLVGSAWLLSRQLPHMVAFVQQLQYELGEWRNR